MHELRLKVEGMDCTGCEASIGKAVSAVPGVADVSAEHATGAVRVTAEGALDEVAVRRAIEDAGYDVVGAESG
ncbi:MAG TPA: heavy metal-associated domain-containing protein [Actinomycetota bacterium]|nr:heavy metal-associated domain-containing protein [Actinomycetota bacterium]